MGHINNSEVKTYEDKKWVHCDRCRKQVLLDDELTGWCISCDEEIIIVWPGEDNASHDVESTPKEPAPKLSTDQLNALIQAARCALADLEGIMPEFESSGDREHPAWQTIDELESALSVIPRQTYEQ